MNGGHRTHNTNRLGSITPRIREVTGLTERELGYLIDQAGIDVKLNGTGTAREWTPLGIAQAVLYGILHRQGFVSNRVAFNACRSLGLTGSDPYVLVGRYLVIDGTTLAFVSNPDDLPETAVRTVVDLDHVLDLVRQVQ